MVATVVTPESQRKAGVEKEMKRSEFEQQCATMGIPVAKREAFAALMGITVEPDVQSWNIEILHDGSPIFSVQAEGADLKSAMSSIMSKCGIRQAAPQVKAQATAAAISTAKPTAIDPRLKVGPDGNIWIMNMRKSTVVVPSPRAGEILTRKAGAPVMVMGETSLDGQRIYVGMACDPISGVIAAKRVLGVLESDLPAPAPTPNPMCVQSSTPAPARRVVSAAPVTPAPALTPVNGKVEVRGERFQLVTLEPGETSYAVGSVVTRQDGMPHVLTSAGEGGRILEGRGHRWNLLGLDAAGEPVIAHGKKGGKFAVAWLTK